MISLEYLDLVTRKRYNDDIHTKVSRPPHALKRNQTL